MPILEPDENLSDAKKRRVETQARQQLQGGEPPQLVQRWLSEQGWGESRARSLVEEVAVEWKNNEPTRLATYFGFHGRIGVGRFWLNNLIESFIFFGALAISVPTGLWWLFYPPFLAVIIISASSSVRRLHDRGRTGWLALVVPIPIIGWFWAIQMVFMSGDEGANEYGEAPEGDRIGVVGGRPKMSRVGKTLDMESSFESLRRKFRRKELSSEGYQAEVNDLVSYPPDLEPGTVQRIRQAVAEDISVATTKGDSWAHGGS